MKLSFILQYLVATLCVSSSVARILSEDRNIAEVVDRLGLTKLLGFATLPEEALGPIVDRLTGDTPTTLFAPTNAAFRALDGGTRDLLENNPEILAQVLLYHTVDGVVEFNDIPEDRTKVLTLLPDAQISAQKVTFGPLCFRFFCPKTARINDSRVIFRDIDASNGVIHVINKVLMPPSVALADIVKTAQAKDLDTLVFALNAADLDETLEGEGPFTVFAPAQRAWRDLPAGLLSSLLEPEAKDTLADILLYHVVVGEVIKKEDISTVPSTATMGNGGTLRISAVGEDILLEDSTSKVAAVTASDITATNGIIHVIDKVLIPGSVDFPRDIIEIASDDPDLTAALAALDDAELADYLDTAGPFTILAPINSAFEDIGGTDDIEFFRLREILTYHIILGDVREETVRALGSAQTLNGRTVDIEVIGDALFIEGARVIEADLVASNGVIHKIDEVLIPPEPECRFFFQFLCDVIDFLF